MLEIPELNYIRQKVGQLSFGTDTIEKYVSYVTQHKFAFRDLKITEQLNKKYTNVCIVGGFPLPLALLFDCRVTIVDDSKILEHYQKDIKDLYNINTTIRDPLFENIQEDIDDKDLIIYHESEFLAPLEYFQHKHKNKDVLIMNTYSNYKHCKNQCYSEQELLEYYPMKEIYSYGKVYFTRNHFTYYSYGIIDD